MTGGGRKKAKYMLYDSLTLQAKHEDGWSKWTGRDGSLFVFKHLRQSERRGSMVGRVYRNRKYLSGLFKTATPSEYSGDMLDTTTGERVFLRFEFTASGRVTILRRVS